MNYVCVKKPEDFRLEFMFLAGQSNANPLQMVDWLTFHRCLLMAELVA
ncbi:hypothetical protein PMIT1323_01152 [Prochlorococcus marinus str. MIT 1323]|nr:hypothetical protein PMIT1323_01152 [Prochlorococcus marinus str. MIT 1323]